MQKRLPLSAARVPGNKNPSAKTSPRWPPQVPQRTSVPPTAARTGLFFKTSTAGSEVAKLGHPVPELNLSTLLKSAESQAAQWYVPARFSYATKVRPHERARRI